MRRLSAVWAAVLMLAACGSPQGAVTTTTATSATTTTPSPTTTTASDSGTTTTVSSMDGVHTMDTTLGTILVDADGMTLYVFTPDEGGDSTCYGSCADLWPPVPGDTAIAGGLDATMFGTTTRTDGTTQLTVDGWPLYRYAPDQAPGDTLGQGLNGVWFVVGPDGAMIEGATGQATPTTTTNPYDYGY